MPRSGMEQTHESRLTFSAITNMGFWSKIFANLACQNQDTAEIGQHLNALNVVKIAFQVHTSRDCQQGNLSATLICIRFSIVGGL